MIKPDDGHYRPKHVVFWSKDITSNQTYTVMLLTTYPLISTHSIYVSGANNVSCSHLLIRMIRLMMMMKMVISKSLDWIMGHAEGCGRVRNIGASNLVGSWVISDRRPHLLKSSVAFLSPSTRNPLRRESQNDHYHSHPFQLTLHWKWHTHSTLQRAWITFIHSSITHTLTEWHWLRCHLKRFTAQEGRTVLGRNKTRLPTETSMARRRTRCGVRPINNFQLITHRRRS